MPPVRPSLPAEARQALIAVVGEPHLLDDAEVVAGFERDWTGRFVGATPAVVRPGSADEVAACLAICDEARVAVVPQGGNTGLVGGGVPLEGEVVLSTRRLDELGAVADLAGQVTAGAGVTLGALQRHVAAAGWSYAVDLAARDSATVGGTVATNAGGMHVLRYGGTRAQLVGVEAVLASGSIVRHLGGLAKDNTGYDLAQLVCGSEGTLAVITAARLRLVPHQPHRVTALVGMRSVADAVQGLARWRSALPSLEAAELVLADGADLVASALGWTSPFAARWPVLVVVEAAGATDPTADLTDVVGGTEGVGDAAVASDAARRAELWRVREEHTAAINQLGPPHKLDVTLPLDRLAAFIEQVPAVIAGVVPEASTWLFGHLGDGNVHVNITGIAADDERADDAVLTMVAEWGGSISAEHGIGRAKRRWLPLQRSTAELATFAAIKRALDPHGILNPGVLLP